MLAKKRPHKNHYKNSRARKREQVIARCVFMAKVMFLLVITVGTSLLFVLAHDALTQSTYFEAKTITVDGNRRLTAKTILEQSNINIGDNILAINLNLLRDRLLANPWIAAVELERDLPDAVHILIQEQMPVAIVQLGQDFYLGKSGEIIKPVEPSDRIDVPVVTGLEIKDFDPNRLERSASSKAVMEVIRLAQLHGSVLPLHSIHRIGIDPQMGVTIAAFENEMVIKLGLKGYNEKFNRMRDMIGYLRQGEHLLDVGCMDLNDLNRVVVRPANERSLLGVCYRKET